jgi:hypothetical protein
MDISERIWIGILQWRIRLSLAMEREKLIMQTRK